MKDVQGVKLTFDKAGLSAFTDGELKIIYVFAAICNRLQLHQTRAFGYWATARDESRSQNARDAAMCGIVESLITLAGELKEAWEAVQSCYYRTQVAKALNPLLPEHVQTALKRCKKHFDGNGIVHYLRNTFAFHHDSEAPLQIAKHLADDNEHSFVIFPSVGKYCEYATKVRLSAIAIELKLTDWDWTRVIEALVNILVKDVYQDMYFVLNGILAELFTKVQLDKETVTESGIRKWHELSGDYYMHVDENDVRQFIQR